MILVYLASLAILYMQSMYVTDSPDHRIYLKHACSHPQCESLSSTLSNTHTPPVTGRIRRVAVRHTCSGHSYCCYFGVMEDVDSLGHTVLLERSLGIVMIVVVAVVVVSIVVVVVDSVVVVASELVVDTVLDHR